MIALTAMIVVSAGLVDLPQGGARRAIPTDSYTSVPLESNRSKGHLWVECEVCGRAVKLVVDTGAGQTFIAPALAARLGLRLGPPVQAFFADGRKTEYRPAEVNLKLGTMTWDAFPVAVMDVSPVLAGLQKVEGVEFAGLLGVDFLGTHDAIIDIRNRRLYLRDTPAEDRAALQGRWRATEVVHHGRARDDARIKEARVEVSGAQFTFRSRDLTCSGTLDLDTGERPRRLDLSDVNLDGQPVPGSHAFAYEVRGDRLRLLMRLAGEGAVDWPGELRSTRENKLTLWTFERVRYELAPPPRPREGGQQ
jgi:uncharacterized protein (TIGR03067 family)